MVVLCALAHWKIIKLFVISVVNLYYKCYLFQYLYEIWHSFFETLFIAFLCV